MLTTIDYRIDKSLSVNNVVNRNEEVSLRFFETSLINQSRRMLEVTIESPLGKTSALAAAFNVAMIEKNAAQVLNFFFLGADLFIFGKDFVVFRTIHTVLRKILFRETTDFVVFGETLFRETMDSGVLGTAFFLETDILVLFRHERRE